MFLKQAISIVVLFFTTSILFGQTSWSLEKCIQYGQKNSLTIQQSQNQLQQSQLALRESKNARYPSINGSLSSGANFGRTINPVTNSFTTTNNLSTNAGVSAGILLYNGGRIQNQIKQQEYYLKATEYDLAQTQNDLALNIAAAYVQILLDQEQLDNVTKQLEQTNNQLERTEKFIQAGTLPRADKLEVLATIENNKQAIIAQKNALEISYLNLKNLMQLAPNEELTIDIPDRIDIPQHEPIENLQLADVYNQALKLQPFIQSDQARLKAVEKGVAIAKSNGLPTLSFGAGLNSYYSNQTPDFTDIKSVGTITLTPPQNVILNGTAAELQTYQLSGVTYGKRNFFNQFNDNFGQNINLSLNIPIYNQDRTRIAKERALINIENTKISAQQNKQKLQIDIQRAIANARSFQKQYEAGQRSLEALTTTFQNTEKKHQIGAANTFELTTVKNNLDQAKINLTIAKYNYIYAIKVIEFYQGKQLNLK